MNTKKNILAICGSTRRNSTNLAYLQAVARLTDDVFEIKIFEGLSDIPHFNPDLDNDRPPEQVVRLRNELKQADGVLICTPEYAMGVPGTLKNAIDWTVSSCEFSGKPTALITASSLGEKAHASLFETLKVIEARITAETSLLISYAKSKIDAEGEIRDRETLSQVKELTVAFNRLM